MDARIDAAADRVADEIVARHTYPPEVLERVAALLGPVPKARRDPSGRVIRSEPPARTVQIRQVIDGQTVRNGARGATT
jgi:hypothetical protein